MKKYIIALLSLVAFVACSSYDEPIYDEPTNNDNNIVEKVIAYANINGAGDTRVALTPGTNAEGNPIIKANWAESGEEFTVYNIDDLNVPDSEAYYFTQVSGNEFTTTNNFPTDSERGYLALYNCTRDGQGLDFDLSKQDGTLNPNYVIMTGKALPSDNLTFNFDHYTTILKPTFKFDRVDIDASIASIEVGNVLVANSSDYSSPQTITVTPSAQEDIYIFIPKPSYALSTDYKYQKDHVFTFKVTTNEGFVFESELTLPIDIETGKFYTATINLNATFSKLPVGDIFRIALNKYITDTGIAYPDIKFVANGNYAEGTALGGTYGCPVYFKTNNQTIEIHTAGDKFIFNDDCSRMFAGFEENPNNNSSTASPNLRNIQTIDFADCCDTSKAKNMSYMFYGCTMLSKISNLNAFNTSNVENMYSMFAYCGSKNAFALESSELDLSCFDTSNVKNMSAMFKSFCWKTLNISNFDTSNVNYMTEMFDGFKGNTLDVSNFDMQNVTSVENMFKNASKLQTLALGNFNIPEGCQMLNMFYYTGSSLGTGNKTQIYVNNQRVTSATNTGINSNYAVFVTPTQQ